MDRAQRRFARLVGNARLDERVRDLAVARLIDVLETAHADELPHLTGRFRTGDEVSRLSRLRAAHATYALATMYGLERASDGAYVRTE